MKIYAEGEMVDPEDLLIDIGTGYYVSMVSN